MSPDQEQAFFERSDSSEHFLQIEMDLHLDEFRLQTGHVTEFGCADRREILGVGKQDGPVIADPLMQRDGALVGLDGQVGDRVIDAKAHVWLLRLWLRVDPI